MVRLAAWLLGCWLALVMGLGGQAGAAVPAVASAPAVAKPPPLRFVIAPYVQDVRTDGIVIAWSTDVVTAGVVRLDAPLRAAFLSTPGTMHKVRLAGLAPGSRYRYVVAARRVGDEQSPETLSPSAEFATAPVSGPFVFMVYGDNRDRDGDHRSVIQLMQTEPADFILQTGDMVSRAGDELQWRRFFRLPRR